MPGGFESRGVGMSVSHGGKTRVFICGGDERLGLDPHESDCPNVENHALHPLGYTAWHEWARTKNKTHKNSKCPGCNRFTIWTPRAVKALGEKS